MYDFDEDEISTDDEDYEEKRDEILENEYWIDSGEDEDIKEELYQELNR